MRTAIYRGSYDDCEYGAYCDDGEVAYWDGCFGDETTTAASWW